MPRLFITPREQNFISDIVKELVKDVNGQKIFYFPISELKTRVHDVYNESPEKIFDAPIEIDALVDQPKYETKVDGFTVDQTSTLDVYVQYRDLRDKNIDVAVGDFFSYGSYFYEITKANYTRNIYGQVEHIDGVLLTGTSARQSQFFAKVFGPTQTKFTDADAVQDKFVQQRGSSETSDRRDLQEDGVLERPLTGPREVSPRGTNSGAGSAFYDE